MKGVVLIFVFVTVFVVSGITQEPQPNRFLSSQSREIFSLLLSRDHNKKVAFINQLQYIECIGNLKSNKSQKLDSIVTKELSVDSLTFVNSVKYEYKFQNDGRLVNLKIFSWDNDLGWIITFNMIYRFNSDDQLIQAEIEMYYTAIYKNFTKIDYTYTNNLITEEILYFKYEIEDRWEEDEQTEYFYDSNNMLAMVFNNVWENYYETWILNEKAEYLNDPIGNVTNESRLTWNANTEVWTEKSRIENSYNENNNLIESIEYVPGWEFAIFVPEFKTELTYYPNSNIKSEIFYNWDYDLYDWLADEKYEYNEGETDKLYEFTGFVWNENSHDWKNNTKSEYYSINMFTQMDINYWECLNIYLPVYSFGSVVCDLIEDYSWIKNEWRKTEVSTYYFSSDLPVGINQLTEAKVLIYPNPTTGYLNVEINNSVETKCVIRDISGRYITQSLIYQKRNFDFSAFQPGIYFVELKQKGQRIFTGKFLKQ